MLRDDFLMRMIRRIGDLIARADGLARQGQHEDAERAIDDAYKTELGIPRAMLDRLDPATVASTLGGEKCVVLTALLDAEAQLAKLVGDEPRATERLARVDVRG